MGKYFAALAQDSYGQYWDKVQIRIWRRVGRAVDLTPLCPIKVVTNLQVLSGLGLQNLVYSQQPEACRTYLDRTAAYVPEATQVQKWHHCTSFRHHCTSF